MARNFSSIAGLAVLLAGLALFVNVTVSADGATSNGIQINRMSLDGISIAAGAVSGGLVELAVRAIALPDPSSGAPKTNLKK